MDEKASTGQVMDWVEAANARYAFAMCQRKVSRAKLSVSADLYRSLAGGLIRGAIQEI